MTLFVILQLLVHVHAPAYDRCVNELSIETRPIVCLQLMLLSIKLDRLFERSVVERRPGLPR